MKYVVYILTALLVLSGLICFVLIIFPELYNYANSNPDLSDLSWYQMASYIIEACGFLTLCVISLIQLKKSTPRLLLLASGCAFFLSFDLILNSQWWGALFTAAGLLSAVYGVIRQGKCIKSVSFWYEKHGGLLIAAGVLGCLCIACNVYSMISNAILYVKEGFDIPPIYYNGIVSIIGSICITLLCFLITRRTKVLFRMFFIGSSTLGVLFFPVNIAYYVIESAKYVYFYVDPVYIINSVVSLALVVLILIHTFKTRHEGILPQTPEVALQQPFTPVV